VRTATAKTNAKAITMNLMRYSTLLKKLLSSKFG
jgi:hypothetical protein